MDQGLRELVDSIATDQNSGASEMMCGVLNGILSVPEKRCAEISSHEWCDFAVELHLAKPSIAPIFNIANSILLIAEQNDRPGDQVRESALDLLTKERRSGNRIAEQAVGSIEGDWLVTVSYSSTVAQTLRTIARKRNIKVTVAEALPGGEGRQFAKLLATHGVETEMVYDSTIFARMEKADGAIVGADAISASGLVNKIGTRTLAEAARCFDRPSYAVSSWSKLCPVTLSDLVIKKKGAEGSLSEFIQIFERTPIDRFSLILTDQGPLSASELTTAIESMPMAKTWKGRGLLSPLSS